MKFVIILGGTYFGLLWLKGHQLSQVMDTCGYPTGSTCQPQLDVINARWSWLLEPSRFIGGI